MDASERNEKIEMYGRGFDLLAETLNVIPREAWKFKPAPAEWSIHEVIIHLADSETNSALRARLLAVEPGRTVMAYDQDKWAQELNYLDQDADESLQLLKYVRLTTYKWLKTLPESAFSHTVQHPEYTEPYSFDLWFSIYSGHIPAHIEQIKTNFALWQTR